MNTYKILFSSLMYAAAFAALPLLAMDDSNKYHYDNFLTTLPSNQEFVAQHSVTDPVLKQLLDTNLDQQTQIEPWGPTHFHWLTSHILKAPCHIQGIRHSRVVGAQLINQCAQELNLAAVRAPVKEFYTIPINQQTAHKSSLAVYSDGGFANICTLAKKIKYMDRPFTLNQVKQIHTIIKKTGYADIHPGNIVNTREGVAYFIDTEYASFNYDLIRWYGYHLPFERPVLALERLKELALEPAAKQWVEEKIDKKFETQLDMTATALSLFL